MKCLLCSCVLFLFTSFTTFQLCQNLRFVLLFLSAGCTALSLKARCLFGVHAHIQTQTQTHTQPVWRKVLCQGPLRAGANYPDSYLLSLCLLSSFLLALSPFSPSTPHPHPPTTVQWLPSIIFHLHLHLCQFHLLFCAHVPCSSSSPLLFFLLFIQSSSFIPTPHYHIIYFLPRASFLYGTNCYSAFNIVKMCSASRMPQSLPLLTSFLISCF